ncbi:phosphoenolpyruvate synthase [Candidatus Peribacteria bacterium]|jgi:pyruvate, water dikinase|nr:phosphoenolpyruvate synthase [Candidatus Peribacteria bacterium]MBT4021320.1 phosphoenolpyruvate synthase [Candidatus Peribacteria bacterium]MBT4474244.1 phosphoenolpyruvate synthase [Candidatus Peribacteria bacterium]
MTKSPKKISRNKKNILWFDELRIKDVPLVGGKNASLGEMYSNLKKKGVRVPYGFAVTAHAYFEFIKEAGIDDDIKRILKGLNTHDVEDLARRGQKVRHTIMDAEFPEYLKKEICDAYDKLCKKEKMAHVDVAVRSSATAEDLPDASFAGQQETYLNIRGKSHVLHACKQCVSSLFTNRAISYREDKGFDHFSIGLSVTVQRMVRSDTGSSGVMFSIDTESGFENAVLINSAYGLGEYVVKGVVNPDEFYVFKPTLKQGKKPILKRMIGSKKKKLVYSGEGNNPTEEKSVSLIDRKKFSITDDHVIQLAKWACIVEDHYKKPMDMEWALDGRTKQLFMVQARPETVHSLKSGDVLEEYSMKERSKVITKGYAVGAKIGVGKARVIEDVKDMVKFQKGEVLITDITDPDWEPIMKIASAIVTDKGGRTSHAAIVSRELGIPAVVGCEDATEVIKTGKEITVSCAEGEVGRVYDKKLAFKIKKTNIKNLKRPKTQIKMNVGTPDVAFGASFIPNDGVGLAREEFIVAEAVGVHPLALMEYKKQPKKIREQIKKKIEGYDSPQDFFVSKLAEGVGMIAGAFYPKEVIVRLSDFKTNEYATMLGGEKYEPQEENPMIGWRGASRYYDDSFKEAFAMECKAMKKVRDEMGLTNLKIMVPFCRTVEEGKKVIAQMSKHGLKQGKDGLEIYVMCEIPANVVLAEEFAKVFDGFSIGSNDLTQLTLGVDRDSHLVAHVFDERNDAVKWMVTHAIKMAKKNKCKIGICGQGPSDHPDFAAFLVEQGIDSMSLNPDTVIKTTLMILEKEKKLKRKKKR